MPGTGDHVPGIQGCGHRGKVSPFDGRGKLPWKLEWCAKWRVFPVTIEGAGQDHSTKGGSRDVASAFKNIQVLKGIPVDQFMDAMGMFSSSLGYDCSSCHSQDIHTDRAAFATTTPLITPG